ncbi:unnamed protein product [Clonostachys solani]|uniref:Uncharacterized protein n=1 Tax=Clonostachys solani TaxID=160281 RepID=A0A9N9ZPL8_9HYPO|nr:unnamed protein product [Clonostachys solani]
MFCHARENGVVTPFCSRHYCQVDGCQKERLAGCHCAEHQCVDVGCDKGRMAGRGRFCEEHGCRHQTIGVGSTSARLTSVDGTGASWRRALSSSVSSIGRSWIRCGVGGFMYTLGLAAMGGGVGDTGMMGTMTNRGMSTTAQSTAADVRDKPRGAPAIARLTSAASLSAQSQGSIPFGIAPYTSAPCRTTQANRLAMDTTTASPLSARDTRAGLRAVEAWWLGTRDTARSI